MKRLLLPACAGILLLSVGFWWRQPGPAMPASQNQAQPEVATGSPEKSPQEARKAENMAPRGDSAPAATEGSSGSRPMSRFFRSISSPDRGKLSRPVIEAYLAKVGRTKTALLASWQESGIDDYLNEAMEKFPDDPHVILSMINSGIPAEERAAWIERFKASTDNPLANYFSAREHFQQGRTQEALAELTAALEKGPFDDYSALMRDEREQLLKEAGLSPIEAVVLATFGTQLPGVSVTGGLRQGLNEAIQNAVAAGDLEGASSLGALGLNLSRNLAGAYDPPILINDLLAVAIEMRVLEVLPAAQATELLGAPVEERKAELQALRQSIRELTQGQDITQAATSEAEIAEYFEITRTQGELAALRWLKDKR